MWSNLPDALRAQLGTESSTISLAAGEWLFHEGDVADAAYLVVSGRLEVVLEGPAEVVIRQLKRGAVVGELALLSHGTRSASVRASRDSELTVLSRQRFEHLMRSEPEFALGLVQVMALQIAENRAPATQPRRPKTMAVVGLDEGAPTAWLASELALALAPYGTIASLTADDGGLEADYPAVLERAEANHRRVLLSTAWHHPGDAWTDFCIKEADRVIAVTRGPVDRGWVGGASDLGGCELIVIDSAASAELLALGAREVQVVRGSVALAAAVAQLARRLAGRAVGLVLSGGGARALAHLGVLDELYAAGVSLDRLAGVSMGSIISGLAATGAPVSEIAGVFDRHIVRSNPSNDYTLPVYSLIRGVKTRRALKVTFGDRRIEELPKRWFCVSTDLGDGQLVEHRTGPMFDAIYASMAIPGIYPPTLHEGKLLIDGGVLDNLPVTPMARRGEGPVIAVDVTLHDTAPAGAGRTGAHPFWRRFRRALTGSEAVLPRLPETLLRTIALGSTDTVANALEHADIVISPRVERVGMLDWKEIERSREIGRQATCAALEAADPKLLS